METVIGLIVFGFMQVLVSKLVLIIDGRGKEREGKMISVEIRKKSSKK